MIIKSNSGIEFNCHLGGYSENMIYDYKNVEIEKKNKKKQTHMIHGKFRHRLFKIYASIVSCKIAITIYRLKSFLF